VKETEDFGDHTACVPREMHCDGCNNKTNHFAKEGMWVCEKCGPKSIEKLAKEQAAEVQGQTTNLGSIQQGVQQVAQKAYAAGSTVAQTAIQAGSTVAQKVSEKIWPQDSKAKEKEQEDFGDHTACVPREMHCDGCDSKTKHFAQEGMWVCEKCGPKSIEKLAKEQGQTSSYNMENIQQGVQQMALKAYDAGSTVAQQAYQAGSTVAQKVSDTIAPQSSKVKETEDFGDHTACVPREMHCDGCDSKTKQFAQEGMWVCEKCGPKSIEKLAKDQGQGQTTPYNMENIQQGVQQVAQKAYDAGSTIAQQTYEAGSTVAQKVSDTIAPQSSKMKEEQMTQDQSIQVTPTFTQTAKEHLPGTKTYALKQGLESSLEQGQKGSIGGTCDPEIREATSAEVSDV
jgi:ribosomal protein L37AE/L43A